MLIPLTLQDSPVVDPAHLYLFSKYARAGECNLFSYGDLQLLDNCLSHEKEEIIQFFLLQLKDAFKDSLTVKLKRIEKMPLKQVQTLEDALYDTEKESGKTHQELMRLCHDIYWDLCSPLEMGIDGTALSLFHAYFFQESEITPKLKWLERKWPQIESYAVGDAYKRIAPKFRLAHKMRYLKSRRKSKGKLSCAIIGGGPAGQIRLLTAWMKGVNCTLYDHFREVSETLVIKLYHMPLLDYFGITDLLLQRESIYPMHFNYLTVDLRDVTHALQELTNSLKATYRTSTDRFIKLTKRSLLCERKRRFVYKPLPDFLIDTTGKKAVVGEACGLSAVPIGEESGIVMVRLQEGCPISPSEDEAFASRYLKQYLLATPKNACEMIYPSAQDRKTLKAGDTALLNEISTQALLDDPNLVAVRQDVASWIASAHYYPIQLQYREPVKELFGCLVQLGGDALVVSDPLSAMGCTTALKGAAPLSALIDYYSTSPALAVALFSFGNKIQTEQALERSLKARLSS